jgi:hypothetical protein
MIAVGLAIGSSAFFYADPGKPKIAVIDIPFTVIKVARLLTTVTGCSVFLSGQLAVSGHQRLRAVFGRPVIRRNIAPAGRIGPTRPVGPSGDRIWRLAGEGF